MRSKDVLLEEVNKLNIKNIEAIKEIIKMEEWTFCLGSGISKSVGFPDWMELVSKMVAQTIYLGLAAETEKCNKSSETEEKESKENDEKEQSEIEAFTLDKLRLLGGVNDVAEFNSKMRDALNGKYASVFSEYNLLEMAEAVKQLIVKDSIDNAGKQNVSERDKNKHAQFFMKQLVRESCIPSKKIKDLEQETIGRIAQLLTNVRTDTKKYVITYNYDNVLEACLRILNKVEQNKIYACWKNDVEAASEKSKDYIIYHVHGYLPQIWEDEIEEKESDQIIFTEESYYDIEKKDYNWLNMIQAYRMSSSSVLFVGFSGQDYNFRRILKNLGDNKQHQHYIFFCMDDLINKIFVGRQKEDDNSEEGASKKGVFEQILFNQILGAQYSYWNKYGLTPIWTTVDEISDLIQSLYEGSN